MFALSKDWSHTHSTLKLGIEEGVFPGAILGIWSRYWPEQFFCAPAGYLWGADSGLPKAPSVNEETIFDLASVSKVIATAAVCGALVDRGHLRWDLPVKKVLSNFPHSKILLSHLLSHTAGYSAWAPLYECMPFEPWQYDRKYLLSILFEKLLDQKLSAEPSNVCLYSDLSFMFLLYIVEAITQMPFEKAVHHLVWKPMGITGFHYRPIKAFPRGVSAELNIAATERCPRRKVILQGQVHDENTWYVGGIAAHAGVFGRVEDVLLFGKKVLGGFYSQTIQDAFFLRVTRPLGCERTMGWDTPTKNGSSSGKFFSQDSIGHLGYTGTSLWIDRTEGLVVTLLSNRVHPTRENQKIKTFRPQIHDAIRQDLKAILG